MHVYVYFIYLSSSSYYYFRCSISDCQFNKPHLDQTCPEGTCISRLTITGQPLKCDPILYYNETACFPLQNLQNDTFFKLETSGASEVKEGNTIESGCTAEFSILFTTGNKFCAFVCFLG